MMDRNPDIPIRRLYPDGKIFNDPIHGNIMLHPLCVKIIDTPQFQRLRLIKQLGAVEFVYYGATHTRFEHCIGTCYLAGVWLKHLIGTLPQGVTITPQEELCVMIAGLCHDLGHGPLSHMFDKFYMKMVKGGTDIAHEELSVMMFEHLIQKNNLTDAFLHFGLDGSHMEIIAHMIYPEKMSHEERQEKKGMMFLYEIVNNIDNGVDVDKFDYFARDCLHVNITNPFDYNRLIKFSRVLKDDKGFRHICFRDKESENLYKMFELRYDLHRQVYSHRVTHTIHIMTADALIRADPFIHLIVPGITKGSFRSVSKMTENIEVFSRLDDMVIWKIGYSTEEDLEVSRQIISDIRLRKFYPLFRTCPEAKTTDNEKEITNILIEKTNAVLNSNHQAPLDDDEKKDIFVSVIKLDFTKEREDPIDSIHFFEKRKEKTHSDTEAGENVNQPIDSMQAAGHSRTTGETNVDEKEETSIKLQQHKKLRLTPREFSQHIVSVCWRNYKHAEAPHKTKALREGFKEWCMTAGYKPNE